MTLVMTLLARDEIDVVDAWLAFHLNAGVDVVIATDNRSQDGTTEVLEGYERSGQVHLNLTKAQIAKAKWDVPPAMSTEAGNPPLSP